MSIGSKITVGFLALVALMVLVQVYQLSLVQRMQLINRHLFEVNYEAGMSSVRLLNELYQIDDFTSKLLATSEPEPYAELLKEMVDDFDRQIERLGSLGLSQQEKEELQGLSRLWRAFGDTLRPILESPEKRVSEETRQGIHRQIGQLLNQTSRLIPATRKGIEGKVRESEATNAQVQTASWVAVGAALVVGLLVAFFIVQSITSPIRQLTRATRELAQGDYSFQVDDTGRDEVARLAQTFNAMVRRLNELDQLKSDFISHVSHELKAPLASMQETTTLLLEEIPGEVNAKQSRLLELNLKCSRRLSAMINNLLDLSRMESGAMEYDFQTCDLAALAGEAVAEMESLAQERGCALALETPQKEFVSTCDAGRVLQVLRNLIDNALKFSPAGSTISIRVEQVAEVPSRTPQRWLERIIDSGHGYGLISVADQGPGVEDEHKERVFDKFHQIKRGRKVAGQGVGLGLAISRTIIEAHRGAIWVADNRPQGSVFLLLLGLGERRAKELTG